MNRSIADGRVLNARPTRALAVIAVWLAAASASAVDYLQDVKPILRERCYACHGALKQEGSLRLDTAALILQGGDSGAAIAAQQPRQSLLLQRVSDADEATRMPPEGAPLTAEQLDLIGRWIAEGAAAPAGEAPEPDPRQHWAFRPPVRTPTPLAADLQPAPANAIDAFLLAEQRRRGVAPRPPAARETQLRRVYLDLIGLPPTSEQLQAFLADTRPDAYSRVVDQLLNSPLHGQRWARHWMDVWRYSDWYGRRHVPDVWNSAPQIWRWRDWIVRSLNRDRGYDQMVQEMLAADEIRPGDGEAAVATGYLIRNWYALNPNDWMRNTVEHSGKAFLGLTFNCAHCHDHKYDPISQDDYFRLRAFFEPIYIRQDQVAGEAAPGAFEDYDYGKLRKIQRLGAVSIFDKSPEAPTWFYTGGDERNRVESRGSIAPGTPASLGGAARIEPLDLPSRGWYPGLRPEIQQTQQEIAEAAVAEAERQLAEAERTAPPPDAALERQAKQAQAAFEAAQREAQSGGRGAVSGAQSLLMDAAAGRRILQNPLPNLASIEDGARLSFQLQLIADAHFNFQFAKDIVQGLTAGYVAFEQGRILAYQPGSFNVFEVGRYDFAGGQRRFEVSLTLDIGEDRCGLSVRSLSDEAALVDGVAVALNHWNPIGNPKQAISFDARTGSVVALDEVTWTRGPAAGPSGAAESRPEAPIHFDFEPPVYQEGRDVIGIDGWTASPLGAAPARSEVSSSAGDAEVRAALDRLQAARRAADRPRLSVAAAAARRTAAQAELTALRARIDADRARYGEAAGDSAALIRDACVAERAAAVAAADADVVARELAVALAEAMPESDAARAKTLQDGAAALAKANEAREKTRGARPPDDYTPLSTQYPRTSTGRRAALARWITDRENPLTARVAVNHLWMRHFHQPLVATVADFGRNGAAPVHPQLLDWLAVELMESGWSMKHLHRLIVNSDAYRRSSAAGDTPDGRLALERDEENRLLWRMNPGRLEAETLRDSLLHCGGRLDCRLDGQELENTEALTTFRRSLYYSCFPEQGGKSALGELFDAPDPFGCYRRTRTIVPQQALALTNSDLVHQVSRDLAHALASTAVDTGGPEAFVEQAFRRVLSRVPSEAERRLCLQYLRDDGASPDAAQARRESLVRSLLNHNDFITIR